MGVECLGVCLGDWGGRWGGGQCSSGHLPLPAAAPDSLCLACAPNTPLSLGSEAAAAGLCAGQCILKVNGNNVMNESALEVLEQFQAFRSRREEALVRHLAAKGIKETLLGGVRGRGPPACCGEKREGSTARRVGWGCLPWTADLGVALCPLCLPEPEAPITHGLGFHRRHMGVIRPSSHCIGMLDKALMGKVDVTVGLGAGVLWRGGVHSLIHPGSVY